MPRSYLYATLVVAAILAIVAGRGPLRRGLEGTAAWSPLQARRETPPDTAAAAEESRSAEGTGLVVSGRGLTLYYVFDPATSEQRGHALTDKGIELLSGSYIVSLNGVRRAVRVPEGRRIALDTGAITVSGIGKNLYSVHEGVQQTQLGSFLTNSITELFPGDYTVVLHGVKVQATVRAGREASLPAGTVVVPGRGSAVYHVYDSTGQSQLASALTNREVELFPGTYVVDLNGSRRTVRVGAREQTVIR